MVGVTSDDVTGVTVDICFVGSVGPIVGYGCGSSGVLVRFVLSDISCNVITCFERLIQYEIHMNI